MISVLNAGIIIHSDEAKGVDGEGDSYKPCTHEQIAKLLEFSDVRTKAIILLMCLGCMNGGALPILR